MIETDSNEYLESLLTKGVVDLIESAKTAGVSVDFIDGLLWELTSESGQQSQREAFVNNYEPEPPDIPNLD